MQVFRPNPAVPCRCERPLVDSDSCLRCGHTVPHVEVIAWAPSIGWLTPEENTPLRRAA